MIENKRIFITGGAGFIGSALVSVLCKHNEIVIYDSFFRNTLQYNTVEKNPNIQIINGDVLDYQHLKKSVRDIDIIIHAAAIAGIDTVLKDQIRTMEVNIIGTANILKVAYESNIKDRVLDFSTSEVFGSMAYRVGEKTNTVTGSAGEARWVYAVSKLAGEHLAQAYFNQYGLPTVTIRPFNVYGPGQTGEGAIQVFIRKALKNEHITLNGDGTQIRAWCYVDDIVEALLAAIENPRAIGESFNIGNSRTVTTIYGLAQTICRVLNSNSKLQFSAALSADIELRIPDTTKAEHILGFKAKVDLEEGILKTADWYKQHLL